MAHLNVNQIVSEYEVRVPERYHKAFGSLK